jgi:CBS domain containing-hemolysin-like protein
VRSILELLAAHAREQRALRRSLAAHAADAGQPAAHDDSSGAGAPPAAGPESSVLDRIGSKTAAAAAAAAQGDVGCSGCLLDISSKVEVAPVVIPPGMPLSFVYHIMQEQGLNFVPVIRHHGPLEGMVTRWGAVWWRVFGLECVASLRLPNNTRAA